MRQKMYLIALLLLCVIMTGCDTKKELTLDYGFGMVETEEYEYGSVVSVPAPSYSGYVFKGWSKTKDGTPEKMNLLLTMDEDYTYYAIWAKLYTITCYFYYFEEGGYSYKTYTYEDGTKITLNDELKWNDDEVPPYQFLGWSTDRNGTNMLSELTVTENISIYGIWDKNIFRISFDLNGGQGTTPAEIKIKKGDYLSYSSLPTSGFSYGVYTFVGWSETKNGKVITSDFKPDKDMTLYAVWLHNGQVKDKTDDN